MAKDNPVLPSRDRLNPVVFHGSVAGILVFLIMTMLFTEQAGAFFDAGLAWVSKTGTTCWRLWRIWCLW